MKLIEPSFEIITQDSGEKGMYRHIEHCGRTCYKSLDKVTDNSAWPFIGRLISSKHLAMLEHGTVYLKIDTDSENIDERFICDRYRHNPYSRVNTGIDENHHHIVYVTTNYRVILENYWLTDLAYSCEQTDRHVKRYTVKFICNRQVSHEFVRHRVFSFAQESTRYCNYNKDKFGKELTFIKPVWYDESPWYMKAILKACLKVIEVSYRFLIKHGWKPQQAATILPNALKTELIMTGFDDDWKHFFDLRALGTTGAPHPQAKQLAEPLLKEFEKRGYNFHFPGIPTLF